MRFSIFIAPQIPPGADAETRRKVAPIGRSTEHYQEMLEEVREIAVWADELGFDAMMLTEHHFHSEGFEASVNPLMIFADLAARTKKLMLAPLGMVLPALDPIRAAEDVAILDQLSQGRLALGVARGYQSRWSSTLFQSRDVAPTNSRDSADEERNQAVFEEMLKIMKMCWTQDTVRYKSDVLDGYSIPFPFEGIEGWPPLEWTREYGAGEVDDDGVIRQVSVIPRPFQEPHPPLWQPFAISEQSLRRCARMGIVPYVLAPRPEDLRAKAQLYQAAAAEYGRELLLGEDIGSLHFCLLGDDKQALMETGSRCIIDDWDRFFGSFGFREALRMPGDPWAPGQIPSSAVTMDRFEECGMALVGSPDEVKRRLGAVVEAAAPDWFGLQMNGLQGVAPLEFVKDQLERFATEIIPEFRDA